LYSLICRYAKVGLIPSQQAEDQDVSNFQLELPSSRQWMASWVKSKLEGSRFAKFFLLLATMLGTAMVIGDGVLTPCMSGILIFSLSLSLSRYIYIYYPLYL
jgi:KUP system potassium uptake protein